MRDVQAVVQHGFALALIHALVSSADHRDEQCIQHQEAGQAPLFCYDTQSDAVKQDHKPQALPGIARFGDAAEVMAKQMLQFWSAASLMACRTPSWMHHEILKYYHHTDKSTKYGQRLCYRTTKSASGMANIGSLPIAMKVAPKKWQTFLWKLLSCGVISCMSLKTQLMFCWIWLHLGQDQAGRASSG